MQNPGWELRDIDARGVEAWLGADWCRTALPDTITPTAKSNLVRIALLHRYGGVWADATTFPVQPLDTWIDAHCATGFFAFDKPVPQRPLATWFLAAHPGNSLLGKWQDLSWQYWEGRAEMDEVHWVHARFKHLLETDAQAAADYAAIKAISAVHLLHFGPKNPVFGQPVPQVIKDGVANRVAPVCKVTNKFPMGPEGTTLDWISRTLSTPAP